MQSKNSLRIAFTSLNLFAPDRGATSGGKPLNTSGRAYHIIRQALASSATLQDLAQQLLKLCEIAYGQRDMVALDEASQVLCNLPLSSAQEFGRFYQAAIAKRTGEIEAAEHSLADLAQGATPRIRARAFQLLGAIHYERGEHREACTYYNQAFDLGRDNDALTLINATFQTSALTSATGDHWQALDVLARLWPMVRAASKAHPHLFFAYHNEVAFELLQLGRLEEAAKYSKIATRSIIAPAYPEWAETRQEIKSAQSAPRTIAVSVSAPISEDAETGEDRLPLRFGRSEPSPIPRSFRDGQSSNHIYSRLILANPSTGPPSALVT